MDCLGSTTQILSQSLQPFAFVPQYDKTLEKTQLHSDHIPAPSERQGDRNYRNKQGEVGDIPYVNPLRCVFLGPIVSDAKVGKVVE